ncbi:MAG: cupin domain-containing protein [Chloroflexota bacterium]
MHRLTRNEVAGTAGAAPNPNFTGPVAMATVHESQPAVPVRVLVVAFPDGARTHWHTHAGGQVLHVIEGRGRTQSRGGPVVELAAGDVVSVPAGEEHWHGAAEGASMSHLAVSLGTTGWGDPPD